jgi:hypothetical protein
MVDYRLFDGLVRFANGDVQQIPMMVEAPT